MNILNLNYLVYLNFFMSLFILVNPIGMIPIFASMTNGFSYKERNKINLVANFSAFIILCFSLFLGNSILNIFKISISSFRIAGGILIILVSLPMINNKNNVKKNIFKKNIAVIPLAMPLISGPGTISSTILWSTQHPYFINKIICIFFMFIFFCCCYLIFKIAPFFSQILGNVGIEIIKKIMGILLLSLGVEFIISGIKCIF
ncbi:YchE family NAAT transporter [Buchnera aphidicola (Periphyllus koelreuteriae)]|uniref:YchE family NAAT transporter n=1 Tax=Buchnera aphidicola TaxID=9 RepID=UPI0031B86CC0